MRAQEERHLSIQRLDQVVAPVQPLAMLHKNLSQAVQLQGELLQLIVAHLGVSLHHQPAGPLHQAPLPSEEMEED